MAKQVITRKDGITYTRNVNTNNYTTHLHIRMDKKLIDELRNVASKKGIKYSELVRNLIKNYIESECE